MKAINKKGQISKAIIVIGILLFVVFFVNLIPVFTDAVDNADAQVLECNAVGYGELNETAGLCFNGTNMSDTQSPTEAGLTGAEETILLLTLTFFAIAGIVFAAKRYGLFQRF